MISIVINCDNRSEKKTNDGLFNGAINNDFIIDGVINKVNFFSGCEVEVILFLDQHQILPEDTILRLYDLCDTVCIRKHTHEELFNDKNYWSALALARGDYIAHFDQDVAAFTSSPEPIKNIINLLETYDYVSYPSYNSPNESHDESFDHLWASTRFFMCKRETIDFTEIRKCMDYDYWIKTYPVNRKCPWMEHWLGSISKYKGKGVFYPPMNTLNYCIFTWKSYTHGTLKHLNKLDYDGIIIWLNSHPIHGHSEINA